MITMREPQHGQGCGRRLALPQRRPLRLGASHGLRQLVRSRRVRAENDDATQQGRKAGNHHNWIERDDAESDRRYQNSAEAHGHLRRQGGLPTPFQRVRKFLELHFEFGDLLAWFVIHVGLVLRETARHIVTKWPL
jgi:hypothetical protein